MKRWKTGWLVLVIMLMTIGGGGCSVRQVGGEAGAPSTPATATAQVERVDILLLESFPVQVRAEVKGDLPDGCTTLGTWTVDREGSTFMVTLPTKRPVDVVCTEALAPYDISIPLDVLGLAAGTYTVDVNGVTVSFELAVDNVSPTPETPVSGNSTAPTDAGELARFALQQTLGREGQAGNEVEIVSVEPAQWSDACLGLGRIDESCAAVITPGYIVTLAVGNVTYVYHTDETGGQLRLAAAPSVDIAAPLLTWTGVGLEGCTQAIFGTDRAAAGACGGPMVTVPIVADFVTRNLPYYVATYAPFKAETPAGTVAITGTGTVAPTPAELQAMAEFARVASGIVASGHAGASYGLAVAYDRVGGIAGFCDRVRIYVTGEAFISSCKGDVSSELARGRLTGIEMEQLFGWMGNFGTFEHTLSDGAVADGMAQTLTFSGRGTVEATQDDAQALVGWSSDIYARLVYGEVHVAGGPLWLTLPEGWSVGPTRETVLGTLTVLGPKPWDATASNSAIYVADADVSLEDAIKRIFCGPSDCTPDVTLEDVTVGGVPAKRSAPAGDANIAWTFLQYDGRTITFTLHDPDTGATLQDTIDTIRLDPIQ